jgi:hypothetical protein
MKLSAISYQLSAFSVVIRLLQFSAYSNNNHKDTKSRRLEDFKIKYMHFVPL